MTDAERQRAVELHWEASNDADLDAVHAIYSDDVVLEFPAKLDFSIRRTFGHGAFWVTEYVISYDGSPVNAVCIMEFADDRVVRETLYFADPFDPPEWRPPLRLDADAAVRAKGGPCGSKIERCARHDSNMRPLPPQGSALSPELRALADATV